MAESERCPRDGQTADWHLTVTGAHPNGTPRTNGEFSGCPFGASQMVPVSLIERCLRLRNADGSHKVPAPARNIIRAAMDEYLRPRCTCAQASLAGLPYDPGCTVHFPSGHHSLGDSDGGLDDGIGMANPFQCSGCDEGYERSCPLHGRLFDDDSADA